MIIQKLKPLIERLPYLSKLYRHLRDYHSLITEPEVSGLGFKFGGNKLMESGAFEPIETRIAKTIFDKVDLVVNVGANIGYYTCLALYSNKSVIAFEPVEQNIKMLLRNIWANGWQNMVELFPIALSNSVGILQIYGGKTAASIIKGWSGASEGYSSLVPCSTMDRIIGNRLAGQRVFVIVDIEGAESLFLDGASLLLDSQPKPIWLLEICTEEHQPSGIQINPNLLGTFDEFWSRGYEVMTASNTPRKIERNEVLKIIDSKNSTLGAHNFIFYEKGVSPIDVLEAQT